MIRSERFVVASNIRMEIFKLACFFVLVWFFLGSFKTWKSSKWSHFKWCPFCLGFTESTVCASENPNSFETFEQAVLSEHAATDGALTLCLPTVTELCVRACVCERKREGESEIGGASDGRITMLVWGSRKGTSVTLYFLKHILTRAMSLPHQSQSIQARAHTHIHKHNIYNMTQWRLFMYGISSLS